MFSVGINRAVVLLAEKKAGGGKGRFQRAAPTVLKELGEHPSEGGKVQVLSGRYGPYVKHGDVNATLPRAKEPAALTMDEAVQLIAERVAKGPSKPKGRRAKKRHRRRRRKAARSAKPKAAKPKQAKKPKPAGPERLRSSSGHLGDSAPQTQTEARRDAGLPSKQEILDYLRTAPPRPASARSRAPSPSRAATASPSRRCLPRWPRRACSPATARASRSAGTCRPSRCWRSSPATRTAS